VKDDVLNTRYYSHYNLDHGKKVERSEHEIAIEKIEQQLNDLRQGQFFLAAERGLSMDQVEDMRE